MRLSRAAMKMRRIQTLRGRGVENIVGASALMFGVFFTPSEGADARTRRYRFKPKYHKPAPAKFRDRRCLRALRGMKVRFKRLRKKRYKGMATPIRVYGRRLGGVRYKARYGRKKMIMDCRLALALKLAGPVFKANGIRTVVHGDFYRWRRVAGSGRLSRHALGLAIDAYAFINAKGRKIAVKGDYEKNLATRRSCEGFAKTWKGRALRGLACDLDASGLFETVLTPDYDHGHRDHFHISVFHPQDRRRYRKHRTALLGSMSRRHRWIRTRPYRGKYSRARVRRVFRSRRRAIRRWYKKRHRKKMLKRRRERKKRLRERRRKRRKRRRRRR